MSARQFHVRVTKEEFIFCCGHFISYEGDKCERLHGHNYRTEVELEGELDQNYYLFDFIALKRLTKAITDELDHHMLLATKNALIRVEERTNDIHVSYREKTWIFPRGDCVLLPIENTTAELLAKYIGQKLLVSLKNECSFVPDGLRVEVEENVGQSAMWVWRA